MEPKNEDLLSRGTFCWASVPAGVELGRLSTLLEGEQWAYPKGMEKCT